MTNWLANHMKGGLRHATAMTASALLVAGTVTAVASPANAAVPEVGPLGLYGPAGNQSSFPTYYKDGTGLALEPCLDNANCGAFPSADLTTLTASSSTTSWRATRARSGSSSDSRAPTSPTASLRR